MSKPKRAKKLERQVAGTFRKVNGLANRAAKKRKGGISAECAAVITGILEGTF